MQILRSSYYVASYYVACTSLQCLPRGRAARDRESSNESKLNSVLRRNSYVRRHSTHFTFCPFKPLTYFVPTPTHSASMPTGSDLAQF